MAAERKRLKEDKQRSKNWKRWGPYLSERQWSTVREDYSTDGNCWDFFPHDHARSRVYRWGEDGLFGFTDRQCRVCLSLALWNGKDSILKERLYGLTSTEGNHGEDVKELYYYLESLPTHSYNKALYKYPQAAFPYADLLAENQRRSRLLPEYEVLDTGVFDHDRYWDVVAEYCKTTPNDVLCRYTVINRSPEPATIHVLPHLWLRNVWSWDDRCDGSLPERPRMRVIAPGKVVIPHPVLGDFFWEVDADPDGKDVDLLFTENETNFQRLYGSPNASPYVKDAFHAYVVEGKKQAVNPAQEGSKCAAHFVLTVPAESSASVRTRLYRHDEAPLHVFSEFNQIFQRKKDETDAFYDEVIDSKSPVERAVCRQAYAGLLWSKQFYHYVIKEWLKGDAKQPLPPKCRQSGRNHDWIHLFNRDVISVPDKWEYPWYASWDLGFHMIPFANIDIEFAKEQLLLFLREWYMHPNGQIPAYEFCFEDVNPPVHAYAVLKVYKATGSKGHRDSIFLARCFHKLVLNFTWWVNKKDPNGKNVFTGGFLGLDNIGVFDRSKPGPIGGYLAQADATAWMAFFCVLMLEISLILARRDPIYEDMASKFFEHFVSIVDAINNVAGEGAPGLWNETDGFYYDHIQYGGCSQALRIRSMVGIVPLFTCLVLRESEMDRFPDFNKRTRWFLNHRKDLAKRISFMSQSGACEETLLLSLVTREQLVRMLHYILDEDEFLSPYGVRSLSKYHDRHPYSFKVGPSEYNVSYEPGEGQTHLFGGNSNWRGPIWLCMNYLLIENLHRNDYYYKDSLKVECPTGSGKFMRLRDVARELSHRLSRLVLPDKFGSRACHGNEERYTKDPNFKDLLLFYEYFHAETGRGCGASHQTGWTALIVNLIRNCHQGSLSSDSTSSLCGGDISVLAL